MSKVIALFHMGRRWTVNNLMLREMQHRAPALMGYMDGIIQEEIGQAQIGGPPITLPSTAAGMSMTGRTLRTHYPLPPHSCPHEANHARKIGNNHGRFRECLACGTVWKALDKDYFVPLTKEAVPIYATQHGIQKSSRRKGRSPDSRGLLLRVGQLLLTFVAAGFGNIRDRPWPEELGLFTGADSSQGSTNYPRIGGVGAGGDDGRCHDATVDDLVKPLSNGIRKRLKHISRKALQMSRSSQELIGEQSARARWPKRGFRFDLVEIFGGTSMISIRGVQAWGLRVLQPVDIRSGCDLRVRTNRRWLLRQLDKWNPRLAVVEYPCTPWSVLQRNVNYRDDPEGLIRIQEADRPFLKLTNDIFRSQLRRGGHALTENPATADSQRQPEIMQLRNDFYETTSCMCRFGMVGKRGLPMMKRVRWIGTHPILIDALDRQCLRDHEHEAVEGSNTSSSAAYPPDLGDTICRAYIQLVQEEDFGVQYNWDTYQP